MRLGGVQRSVLAPPDLDYDQIQILIFISIIANQLPPDGEVHTLLHRSPAIQKIDDDLLCRTEAPDAVSPISARFGKQARRFREMY